MPTQSNLMGSGCPALQAQASVGLLTTNSNALTAFAVDPVTGALTPKASLELPSPNYVHAL